MANLYDDILALSVARWPSHTALLSGESPSERLSYKELDGWVGRLTGQLMQAGVGAGDRVAITAPNSIVLAAAIFAIARLNAVVVPIAALLKPAEVSMVLADAQPSVYLVSETLPEAFQSALVGAPPEMTFGLLREDGSAQLSGRTARSPGGSPDGLAFLIYTSGSTGRPKGVMLSHANLVHNARASAEVVDAFDAGSPGRGYLGVLPFFHSFGLTTALLLPLAVGAASVLFRSFNPRSVVRAMADGQLSLLLLVPEMYRALNLLADLQPLPAESLYSLRGAVSGGAPMPAAIAETFETRYGVPIHQGYGLTETSPVLSIGDLHEPPARGTSGQALRDVRLAVCDDRQQAVPANHEGVLWAAGPPLALGYWRNPLLTAERFQILDLDGSGRRRWFDTRDRAMLDPDGNLIVLGRTDDMMIVNGLNVYPAEIANVLLAHPSVAECGVGRIHSDAHGQEPVAVVVLRADAMASEDALRAFCRDRLAAHKLPARIHLIPELPKTPVGKPLPAEALRRLGYTVV